MQWLVTQGDNQFSTDSLLDIEQMARRGELKGGDMIQPPGSNEWIYVTEVPELKAILDEGGGDGDDDLDGDFNAKRAAGVAASGVVVMMMLAFIVIGGGLMFMFAQQLPRGDESLLGEGGLAFSEMIVTEAGVGLRSEPDDKAQMVEPLKKDAVLDLLAKRGEHYRARTRGGAEGWIGVTQVIPMYQLGGADIRDEYDPLYNPDRYVEVVNASWMQLPGEDPTDPDNLSDVTIFEFMISNTSKYAMTDLVLLATIKDSKGQELEKVEIPIDGMLPSKSRTMVGTLAPEDADDRKRGDDEPFDPGEMMTNYSFSKLAEEDPEMQFRWTSGVQAQMQTEEFTNAEIDILELRAAPDEEAAAVVSSND